MIAASRSAKVCVALSGLVLSGSAWAGSAADALMGALAPGAASPASPAAGNQPTPSFGAAVKLTDPFLMQFFAAWQTEKNLPFEVNAWALKIVQQQFADAAHLWTAIQPKMPESFSQTAQAAQLYLLYRLDLPHTFVSQYVTAVQSAPLAESRAFAALDQTIAPGFDRWLADRELVASEQQVAALIATPRRGMLDTTLKAWASLRKGEKALETLEALPADSAFKIALGQTVALALARKGDLAGAAGVLKRHVEPGIESKKDAHALGSHYLEVARLLYRAGSLDGAEAFYSKVPSGSSDFIKAREELTWVWLRKGDVSHLRGELTTLSSKVFEDGFSPELYLVRAISNLKLCYYDEVRKDFDAFLVANRRWAGQISSALKGPENQGVPAPPAAWTDAYARQAESMLAKRQAEAERLDALGKQSIAAVLPAVGPQSHWTQARESVLAALESGKKHRDAEYRRLWKNAKTTLSEAIRKMRFVKVELLTQVRLAARLQDSDRISTSTSAPVRDAASTPPSGDMSFPFDGVLWPDELFNLRSATRGRCLTMVQGGST